MTYTSSSAKASIGTTFTWNSVAVSEITSLSGPKLTGRKIEVTNFNSGNYAEYLMGIMDTGTLTITCNYLAGDAGQYNMISDAASRTSRAWAIDFPTVGAFSGNGYVESYETSADISGAVKISYTICVTGTITPSST